ncbi:F-box domain protein [Aspergillus eucalypticola CBS 122712]|uniref:F-box domain protein n=1 Tax=Aspergillus eucalypticola (strain CBS 122712 / IBT 29274) TaxID=1448314 RepID=A0A317USM4_ASPEC|nr:F-box domain protein [Aspergillus eucalypticola CBS 122712]PWY64625.1 F-box domain protein [Aspergillus eucalypticola CBS 122712]
MSLLHSPLESLPNELLDQIISELSASPPSQSRVHKPPCMRITTSRTRDLKNLARTSSRLLELVRPHLFAHACFDIKDVADFVSFITSLDLGRYVISIVAKGMDSPDHREDPYWWRPVLDSLDPLRIIVIAPPPFLAAMLDTRIMDGHSWAFEIPFQVLQLEQNSRVFKPPLLSEPKHPASLFETRVWSSFAFNESSSLRAYNHYEYFMFQVPSLFNKWGTVASTQMFSERLNLSRSLKSFTSFNYTAVFPFYNHVKLVLDAVELMANLRSLSIQLAPSPNDKITEMEQRGSMDPSDPWMEIATGYSLIAHTVRKMGALASLVEFRTPDYEFDALRSELSTILGDVLDSSGWVHDGRGTWTKVPSNGENDRLGSPTTPSGELGFIKSGTTFVRETQIYSTPYALQSYAFFPPFRPVKTIMSINAYIGDAEPARPVLAHTLLPSGSSAKTKRQQDQQHSAEQSWNLSDDVQKGLQNSPDSVFRSGIVIGFSRLRDGHKETSDEDEYIGRLPRHLLTTHLLHQHQHDTHQPKTYIIHPANFSAFTPQRLLTCLLNKQQQQQQLPLSRTQAITLLDSVQLFPVYDFNAAAQAIHEIASTISSASTETTPHQQHIIIITGLDTLAKGVIRASNPLRGSAMLTSVLRTLTQLTRTHGSNLSVMLVNTSGLGKMMSTQSRGVGEEVDANATGGMLEMDDGEGIQSAFRAHSGEMFPSLLMRTLDQGIDSHLLVSSIGRVPVVEVIKDRVGGNVGRWCVWEGEV